MNATRKARRQETDRITDLLIHEATARKHTITISRTSVYFESVNAPFIYQHCSFRILFVNGELWRS